MIFIILHIIFGITVFKFRNCRLQMIAKNIFYFNNVQTSNFYCSGKAVIVWMTRKIGVLMLKVNAFIVILCLAESHSISICLGSDSMRNNVLAPLSSEYVAQNDITSNVLYISEVISIWTCYILHILWIRVRSPSWLQFLKRWSCFIREQKNRYV